MNKILLLAIVASVMTTILGHRPERRPGNLAPVQLISAVGAWTLVFANAAAMAIAIRDGSAILLCTVAATLAIALITFIRDDVTRISNRETPESVRLVIDDVKQLLGGAPRLGMNSLEAVVVDGRCPGIGISVPGRGRVVVRIRRDIVPWLEKHRQPGGAGSAVVASFVRFIVLHELGHVLNGDHRTYRFVRSVLVAHLVWIGGAAALAASLLLNPAHSTAPLFVASSIVLIFVTQSLVARGFIAKREQLADWRAMQTLAPAEAAQLLERRGRRRAVPNPTELEKLMIDLKAQAPTDGGRTLLSWLVRLVWPEGDDIHRRSEMAGVERVRAAPQPVQWAALLGMQCGLFSMTLALAALFAVAPSMGWHRDLAGTVMMTIATWISGPAVAFCGVRVDPARMNVREVKRGGVRFLVGLVFFVAFAAAALVLYRFQLRFAVASMPPALHFAVVLMVVGAMVALSAWASGLEGAKDGGGELRDIPRSPWVQVYPGVAVFVLILLPLSVVLSSRLGIGSITSGHWLVLMSMSIVTLAVSTSMARSTNATLRVIAPMAMLDTPAPVYGFRVFWRDFYIDLSRTTLARAMATAVAVYLVAAPFFLLVIALLMQRVRAVLTAEATYAVMFWGSFGIVLLILVIPGRYDGYGGPWMRLLDRSRLQVFEKLLAAARAANLPDVGWLEAALVRWLRNERFPDVLLPDPHGVWTLVPLLSLVRLARETGETAVLDRWRARIEHSLRQIISNDAVAVAPGQPPSMYWTTLTATIIDETNLREAFPFERMLDRIETLLDERLAHGTDNLLTDIVSACRLLCRQGRMGPDPQSIRRFAGSSSLVSRPLLRQSLSELWELADLTGDSALRETLGPIVRSRSWEALQLNPRKDVLLLLDCYLAAAYLGETNPRQAAAAALVGELAQRVSDELMAITDHAPGAPSRRSSA